MYLSTAHLQHLQTQPQNEQNVELERKLRRQKEMLEQMLNQKVKVAYTVMCSVLFCIIHLTAVNFKVSSYSPF